MTVKINTISIECYRLLTYRLAHVGRRGRKVNRLAKRHRTLGICMGRPCAGFLQQQPGSSFIVLTLHSQVTRQHSSSIESLARPPKTVSSRHLRIDPTQVRISPGIAVANRSLLPPPTEEKPIH